MVPLIFALPCDHIFLVFFLCSFFLPSQSGSLFFMVYQNPTSMIVIDIDITYYYINHADHVYLVGSLPQ